MPYGKPPKEFPKIDTLGVIETFSDSLGQVIFDGQHLRIEFCVLRFDDLQPPTSWQYKPAPQGRKAQTNRKARRKQQRPR